MSTLSVQTRNEGETVVVALVGAAGLGGAEALERELTTLSARRPPRGVFDLSQLTFISSMGIGVLVGFQRDVTAWHGTMALAGATDNVATALRRCRLDELFVMTPTPPRGGVT